MIRLTAGSFNTDADDRDSFLPSARRIKRLAAFFKKRGIAAMKKAPGPREARPSQSIREFATTISKTGKVNLKAVG